MAGERVVRPEARLVIALDVPGEREALVWAKRLKGRVGYFKIGLQLFTAAGPSLVSRIADEHGPVFLDLKLHDIPNTVAGAVRAAGTLGASLLTVHASGGMAMLRAASEAAGESSRGPGAAPLRLLAVTVLTSLGPDDLAAAGVARGARAQVLALAELAWLSGCDGFVASPLETAALREKFGKSPLLVIPGIRPADPGDPRGPAPTPTRRDDQTRTATPREALDAGADYLVIGRPVLGAPDPEATLDAIIASLS
jgi:orotidine-5'-phosphate decarboxylase